MVRINLLQNIETEKKNGISIPARVYYLIGLCAGIAILSAAGYWLYDNYMVSIFKKSAEPSSVSVSKPRTGSKVLEDVVREVGENSDLQRKTGLLRLDYEEMSLKEKINYEMLFAGKIFDLLARSVPEEVGFRNFKADNFTTLSGSGICTDRGPVGRFLKTLREKENVRLLPPPHTSISKFDGGYRVKFACVKQFGLDLKDTDVDLSLGYLPTKELFPSVLKDFIETAREYGIRFENPPARTGIETGSGYRRYSYHFNAYSSFNQFVRFVKGLDIQSVPCAFEHLNLVAKNSNRLSIESDIIFTTLN